MKRVIKVLSIVLVLSMIAGTGLFAGGQQEASGASSAEAKALSVGVDPNAKIESTGPHGEIATSAATVKLTKEEVEKIRSMNCTAAIVLHYAGNDWSSAQVKGLKDTFEILNIKVIAITDANFKVEKQVSDIETVMAQSPDIIISIPVDPVSTSSAYKKAAAEGVKIVFMDNTPSNMTQGEEYVSVVSADNYGNGVAAANIMAEQLDGKGKVGVIFFDTNFFVTNQRVEAFEKTIEKKYPGINIIDRGGFTDPNKVSEVADGMLTKYPDIDGIFAVWDVPAEAVVSAAKAAGRTDLVVTTIDLGNNAAREIAGMGIIKGLGAQLPYDQGVAEALLAAGVLLGKDAPAYVAVPALPVTYDNILEAYEQVYHIEAPEEVSNAYNSIEGK